MRIAIAIFSLGTFASIVQVLLLRELLVAYSGNELVIGLLYAAWFLLIGIGALAARPVAARCPVHAVRTVIGAGMLLQAVALPCQLWIARILRLWLHVMPGETAGPGAIIATSFIVVAPTCLLTGLLFPLAIHMAAHKKSHPLARLYVLETIGFAVGGLLFTFIFADHIHAFRIALVAALFAACGVAFLARPGLVRGCAFTLLVAGAVMIAYPRAPDILEKLSINARWRAAGFLGSAAPGASVAASRDTRYQNLAVIASHGQYDVFAEGEAVFSFPDAYAYEHYVHFVMAQRTDVQKVLVIGGNPLGMIPELLRYPVLKRLVYVVPDPGMVAILQSVAPAAWQAITADPRVSINSCDGPRFLMTNRERYDVVISCASEPTTACANRYFTREYFIAAYRALAPHGVFIASIAASERLEHLMALRAASIYRTLSETFPRLKVTAGARLHFFAGGPSSQITLDRDELASLSKWANLSTKWFRPEYFRACEELDPDKIAQVTWRIEQVGARPNTIARPVVFLHSLAVWAQWTGSRFAGLMQKASSWDLVSLSNRFGKQVAAMAALIVSLLLAGGWLAGRTSFGPRWAVATGTMLASLTGFAMIAFELILMLLLQSLHGFVYSQVGLIVAVFMMGLAAGGLVAATAEHATDRHISLLFEVQACMILVSVAIPFGVPFAVEGAGVPRSAWFLYVLMATGGCMAGAQFVLLNALNKTLGSRIWSTAAMTTAMDHVGAAAGALAGGVLAIPVFGIAGSAVLLAGVHTIGLVMLVSVALASRPGVPR